MKKETAISSLIANLELSEQQEIKLREWLSRNAVMIEISNVIDHIDMKQHPEEYKDQVKKSIAFKLGDFLSTQGLVEEMPVNENTTNIVADFILIRGHK